LQDSTLRVHLGLTHKYQNRLETLVRDKCSSLLGLVISDEEKKVLQLCLQLSSKMFSNLASYIFGSTAENGEPEVPVPGEVLQAPENVGQVSMS
jgi:hypothetical protein